MPGAYKFRYLTPEQQAEIAEQVTAEPAADTPDESLLAAWEADLAGHMALLEAATDDEAKKVHADAIKTLRKALGG